MSQIRLLLNILKPGKEFRRNYKSWACYLAAYFSKMAMSTRLIFIKVLHTIIWIFFNVVLFYMLYAVLTDRIDILVWIGIALILLEGLVLLAFKNMCPLTVIARSYSDSEKANFDIYLPNWLARHNKIIYTTIFAFIICILIYRLAE